MENKVSLLLIFGALVFLFGLISWIFLKKTPPVLGKLIEYLNLAAVNKKPAEIFAYSKLLKMWPNITWEYFLGGKRAGREVNFGVFYSNGTKYFLCSIKDEVKPLIVSNIEIDNNWPQKVKIENLFAYAKEEYLLNNAKRSDQFILDIQYLFKGQQNFLEFTDLNQIIYITDYEFNNTKELLEVFAKFSHIKEHL